MELSSTSYASRLEAPAQADPLSAYEQHFGALPNWFDEITVSAARSLALQSLRRGAPLAPADDFYQ